MNKNLLYRSIPKVNVLLEDEQIKEMIDTYGRNLVMEAIRNVTDELRAYIGKIDDGKKCAYTVEGAEKKIASLYFDIQAYIDTYTTPNMRPVVNATGTILHTNLGRALISEKHAERLMQIVTGYSNLEYNLEAGKRGERYSHFEKLLCKLTGAEAAMAVNNNASAVMLILSSMAKGGEVIVSRGELVEIGGKFRVPDVMTQSGAILHEVGTTNKTHYSDYEEAVGENTKAFLKVHTSNYRIIGFTENVPVSDLASLSQETGIPVIEDLGSGVLVDLSKYGLTYEPTVQDSIRAGADVVCFSGDKLLGGPQAGIIIGKKKYIDMMKNNQLTRALRIDKFTAAALELVLEEYLCEEKAVENIPVLRMIRESKEVVEERAKNLKTLLEAKLSEHMQSAVVEHMQSAVVEYMQSDVVERMSSAAVERMQSDEAISAAHESNSAEFKANVNAATSVVCALELEPCESQIGGGSLPLERIESVALSLKPERISVPALEEAMRKLPVPIIGRTYNDKIYLDLRTVKDSQLELVADELADIL